MTSDQPLILDVVVEQPRDEPFRVQFIPETGQFVRTSRAALLHERGFAGCYGWIVGSGAPPGPHWDVYVCTERAHSPGDVVVAVLCGVFLRDDGDHKFVALGPDLAAAGIEPDVERFPEPVLTNLRALYPRVSPTEGWRGAAFARALVRTGPTHS